MSTVLLLIAIILFVLDAVGFKAGGVNLQSIGLASWAAAAFEWPPLRRP